MEGLKRHKALFWMSVAAATGLAALLFHQHRVSKPGGAAPLQPLPRDFDSRLKVRGFRFDGHYKGKKVLSIRGDTFVIEKKKVGFFRIGMLNVARISNAELEIFGDGKGTGTKEKGAKGEVDPESPLLGSKPPSFRDAFNKEALPPIPGEGVYSFVMEPVRVTLYSGGKAVTRVTAGRASVGLKSRDIVFKGNVRVESGARRLETTQLSFVPQKGWLTAQRHFVLMTPAGRLEGKRLVVDIFLNVEHFSE